MLDAINEFICVEVGDDVVVIDSNIVSDDVDVITDVADCIDVKVREYINVLINPCPRMKLIV